MSERSDGGRAQELCAFHVGTEIWRDFDDFEGYLHRYHDYKTPYWRLFYIDGDSEELTKTKIERSIKLGAAWKRG